MAVSKKLGSGEEIMERIQGHMGLLIREHRSLIRKPTDQPINQNPVKSHNMVN